MANLELVEGNGNFPACFCGDTELLPGLPAVLGGIGVGVAVDCIWCILGQRLLPFLMYMV
jgi:hypothetical protein